MRTSAAPTDGCGSSWLQTWPAKSTQESSMAKKLTPAQRKVVAKNVRIEKMNRAKQQLKTKQARAAADKNARRARAKATRDLGSIWEHLGD
jgi:hypothetical protein